MCIQIGSLSTKPLLPWSARWTTWSSLWIRWVNKANKAIDQSEEAKRVGHWVSQNSASNSQAQLSLILDPMRGKDGNPCFLLPITANLKLVANHIFVSKRTMVEGDGQTMHFISFIEIDIWAILSKMLRDQQIIVAWP